MNFEDFFNKFASQFQDSDIKNVKTDGFFRDLDTWDSLTAMAVMAMIQDEYNVTITVDEFKTLKTPREVFSFIENKIKNL